MFLLGSADFVRRGLADGFADGRPGHAVLCGGDPVGQRLSRHVTEEAAVVVVEEVEEEEEDEEAGGGVMVESGWGEPGRTIKMSLAAGKRRRRRVVPSVRIGQRREKRRRWWWWRTAAYTDQDPVGEFMRRPNKALNGHTSREASKNPAQGNRVAQLQK